MRTDGQTEGLRERHEKLIVALRNLAKAPESTTDKDKRFGR